MLKTVLQTTFLVYIHLSVIIASPNNSLADVKKILDREVQKYDGKCSTNVYPFMVRLTIFVENKNKTYYLMTKCGGTLIAPKWVLTAAWCCLDMPDHSQSISIEAALDSSLIPVRVIECKLHPEFDDKSGNPHYLDIAMLGLRDPLSEKNDGITFARLPEQGNSRLTCRTGLVMGWEPEREAKQKLHCGTVSIKSNTWCQQTFTKDQLEIGPNQICTYAQEDFKLLGSTFYGGPLLCDSVQVAIVTRPHPNHDYNHDYSTPAVYTEVGSYLDFIHNTIEEKEIQQSSGGGNCVHTFDVNHIFINILIIIIFGINYTH